MSRDLAIVDWATYELVTLLQTTRINSVGGRKPF